MDYFSAVVFIALVFAKYTYFQHQTGLAWTAWTVILRPVMWGTIPTAVFVFPDPLEWLFYSWTIGFAIIFALTYFGFKLSPKQASTGGDVQRGTEVITTSALVKQIKKEKHPTASVLAGVPVPTDLETLNFLFSGAPGSGKSLAFNQLLLSARDRGHRAIIADVGGEFTKNFFRDGDQIFNPFDERGIRWSPFAEMRQSYDAARLAASIIPAGKGGSEEWNGYARTIVEGVLERCFETGQTTNQAFIYYLLGASPEECRDLLEGTPAASYYKEGNERMLGSILGIVSSYAKAYTYLDPTAGKDDFSIRAWMENDGDSWLFVSFRDDQLQALRPLVAAVLDIAASALLSMPVRLDRRVWFALDEFATLGYINSIEPLLSKGRKYGACAILGYQSIGQPRMIYGREMAQTLLSCLGTWLVLKQPDAESADYMSQYLGDEERRRVVDSGGSSEGGSSENWSEQIVRQRAVMPAELQQLGKRQGILNLAGPLPPAWVEVPITRIEPAAEPFVDRANIRAMRIERPAAAGAASYTAPTPAADLDDDQEQAADAVAAADEPETTATPAAPRDPFDPFS